MKNSQKLIICNIGPRVPGSWRSLPRGFFFFVNFLAVNMSVKIKGGYVLEAKCIDSSDIAKASPVTREVWSYLRRNANYKDMTGKNGKIIKRGEILTSYKQIIEGLSWFVGYRKMKYSKSQIQSAMKTLRDTAMITTTKTTRGIIVKVVKYNFYQDFKNYEDSNENSNEDPTGNPRINKGSKERKEKKKNKYIEIADAAIDYLNKKRRVPEKYYFAHSDANRKPIIARLKEGHTLKEFKQIIDNKSEWVGTPQQKYFRTQTLFIPLHFDDYLKNPPIKNQNTGHAPSGMMTEAEQMAAAGVVLKKEVKND